MRDKLASGRPGLRDTGYSDDVWDSKAALVAARFASRELRAVIGREDDEGFARLSRLIEPIEEKAYSSIQTAHTVVIIGGVLSKSLCVDADLREYCYVVSLVGDFRDATLLAKKRQMCVRVSDCEEKWIWRFSDKGIGNFSDLADVTVGEADGVPIVPPHIDREIRLRIDVELSDQASAIAFLLQDAKQIREGFVLRVFVGGQSDLAGLVRV